MFVTVDKCYGDNCAGTEEERAQFFANIIAVVFWINDNYLDYDDIENPVKSFPIQH